MSSVGHNVVQFRLPMLPHPDEVEWNATVNGEEASIFIESNAILLDVLRDILGSLGTKRGCDMGTCGCCSILIDGEARLSCLTLAIEVNGTSITTVEGIRDFYKGKYGSIENFKEKLRKEREKFVKEIKDRSEGE